MSNPTNPIVVTNEADFNAAINQVNQGQAALIDVQGSFTLTNDLASITKSVEIMSSNNSQIADNGFAVLSISNGACVTFSVNAGGTGESTLDGSGSNGQLIGKTGGALANLMVVNDGSFQVNQGDQFAVNNVSIEPGEGIAAGMTVTGILLNRGVISATQGIINVGPVSAQPSPPTGKIELAAPSIGDLDLVSESFLKIAPGTTLIAGKIRLAAHCQISSDCTGAIWSETPIEVCGNPPFDPGKILGVNVHKIELLDGGTFGGNTTSNIYGTFTNGKADSIVNTSGVFDMGTIGNCTVGEYRQTGGTLQFELQDFKGDAACLNITKSAEISGGKFLINALLYYVPAGTTSQSIKLITAPPNVVAALAKMATFQSFPSGITPSVSVQGNVLSLILTVQS